MLMIHTALHAEALALINHYKLKRQHHFKPFACYASDSIFLIESGIGKLHTAAAISWATASINIDTPAWLNVGMAGHLSHAVGACFLVRHVTDERNGQQLTAGQLLSDSIGREDLLTVDGPVDHYPIDGMVDMEGSAFFQTARRFTPLEFIQSVKVISDNRQNPAQRLKTHAVEALFSPHIGLIDQIIRQLQSLRIQTIAQTGDNI